MFAQKIYPSFKPQINEPETVKEFYLHQISPQLLEHKLCATHYHKNTLSDIVGVVFVNYAVTLLNCPFCLQCNSLYAVNYRLQTLFDMSELRK